MNLPFTATVTPAYIGGQPVFSRKCAHGIALAQVSAPRQYWAISSLHSYPTSNSTRHIYLLRHILLHFSSTVNEVPVWNATDNTKTAKFLCDDCSWLTALRTYGLGEEVGIPSGIHPRLTY